MDKETSAILTQGQKWARLLLSEEWKMVRDKLMEKLIELSDLTLIDDSDPQALLEIKSRKKVLETLHGLIREIEGEGSKGEFNTEMFRQNRQDDIIKRFDA